MLSKLFTLPTIPSVPYSCIYNICPYIPLRWLVFLATCPAWEFRKSKTVKPLVINGQRELFSGNYYFRCTSEVAHTSVCVQYQHPLDCHFAMRVLCLSIHALCIQYMLADLHNCHVIRCYASFIASLQPDKKDFWSWLAPYTYHFTLAAFDDFTAWRLVKLIIHTLTSKPIHDFYLQPF